MREITLDYYYILRSVLRNHPRLRPGLTRCQHCRIFFLTSPRNASRHDIGCPFGCREARRRKNSTKRSVEYYRTREGKKKKAEQNQKRGRAFRSDVDNADKNTPGESFIRYLQGVAGLIERRRVTQDEILKVLRKKMRQHSIGRKNKIMDSVQYLKKHPP